jgi:hypothetical protein
MSDPADDDDLFWKVAHRFRPVHGVMLFSFVTLFMCCGSCGLLRSCRTETSETKISAATIEKLKEAKETQNFVDELVQIERKTGTAPNKVEKFAYEDRIVAERLTVAEWERVSQRTKCSVVAYLAAKWHSSDSDQENLIRRCRYYDFIERLSKIPDVQAAQIQEAIREVEKRLAEEIPSRSDDVT